MAYLVIHCEECGDEWEIYHRDNWNDDRARQCPHCFRKIDPQTWQKFILPAFAAVSDANAELQKDHTGTNTPLFTVDVMGDRPLYGRDLASET